MKLSPQEQESIIGLLTRMYMDILDIEQQFGLLVGDGDFRARIEYFHDAIRAFTSQDKKDRDVGGRLIIEVLAYDVGCLRYIQSMPLASFKPHASVLAPGTEVMAMGDGQAIAARANRPDRGIKERLAELYQGYGVLFVALLKPLADHDYQDRIDDINQDVQELGALINQIDNLAQGKGTIAEAVALVNHIEDDKLRKLLMAFLQEKLFKSKPDIQKLHSALKQEIINKDKRIKGIEKAHLDYSLTQLALYEGSKDMLKKMAAQGMNLVGKFVESSMAEVRGQMGR